MTISCFQICIIYKLVPIVYKCIRLDKEPLSLVSDIQSSRHKITGKRQLMW